MADSLTSVSEVHILDFDANRFAGLLCADERDLDRLVGRFHGAPIGDRWEPIHMYWETNNGSRPVSDFSTISGGGIVFNDRALEALGDLLEGRGELLPLEVEGAGEHHVFNVTRISDALDDDRSEFVYFRSGRVMDIDTYEFDPQRLSAETIFKLPQIAAMYKFVTDVFRRRVQEAGLTGFIWDRRVWSAAEAVHAAQSDAEHG